MYRCSGSRQGSGVCGQRRNLVVTSLLPWPHFSPSSLTPSAHQPIPARSSVALLSELLSSSLPRFLKFPSPPEPFTPSPLTCSSSQCFSFFFSSLRRSRRAPVTKPPTASPSFLASREPRIAGKFTHYFLSGGLGFVVRPRFWLPPPRSQACATRPRPAPATSRTFPPLTSRSLRRISFGEPSAQVRRVVRSTALVLAAPVCVAVKDQMRLRTAERRGTALRGCTVIYHPSP